MMRQERSPFLAVPASEYVVQNALAFVIFDQYPVTPGHALVIPFRQVSTWFDATRDEQLAVMALVDQVRDLLSQGVLQPDGTTKIPDGYNVGFNAGEAAGQTVMHLHMHVIPRYQGDMDDPRGGVRHVIPSKGNYLAAPKAAPFTAGGSDDPLLSRLRPLFEGATGVFIVAAFVRLAGLKTLEKLMREAVDRGARVQLLTGDYLGITQPEALQTLLDWAAVSRLSDTDDAEPSPTQGAIEARVFETGNLKPSISFHPKAWRFEFSNACQDVVFVGSSNISHSALCQGIEWSVGIERAKEPKTFERIRCAFQDLWERARTLDPAWIQAYEARRPALYKSPTEPAQDDGLQPLPEPHTIQQEALAALRAARASGHLRALVILATGLGKTLLSVLDYGQLAASLQRRPRLLFVAHRREILLQARQHYQRFARDHGQTLSFGWCAEDSDEINADAVFASVGKLARPTMLKKLRAQTFDYVVIDEVHHAAAASYQRILDALNAGFLLGLTATPERADDQDIFGLFNDFVAYRADISRGISEKFLVPFSYFGVKDDIDYGNIPWRNRRFEPAALAQAAQTEARMQTLLRAWNEHPGSRTLIFCCSVEHAKFVRGWLNQQGMRVEAVFSGPESDDRERALKRLREGHTEAICSVDVFNEGVDVREVDRVVMLRPTESNTVFMQQLGRGLRVHAQKNNLTVIDFVGNHRLFLERMGSLLSLSESASTVDQLRAYLQEDALLALPPGCSVALELEAKDVLARLFRSQVNAADTVERAYQTLRLVHGRRPTAGELLRGGHDPTHLTKAWGGWFSFVKADLLPDEAAAAQAARSLLERVERTEMSKCFKMVMLEAMLELDALALGGVALADVAARAWAVLSRYPGLRDEVPDAYRPTQDPAVDRTWLAYWRKNPVAAWTTAKKNRTPEMRLTHDRISLDVDIDPDLRPALAALLRELVDYRLTRYRRRLDRASTSAQFVCKVMRNGGNKPILKLPPRDQVAIPEGEHEARLPDGSVWRFRLMAEFCNVAQSLNADKNQLPELLYRWFGLTAGARGTQFQVQFSASPDGLWVKPVADNVIHLARRHPISFYPDLRAAAGPATAQDLPAGEAVVLPIEPDPARFAVRVAGDSMNGGPNPLRDGDWAVMRLERGAALSALNKQVVLVESVSEGEGARYQLKRLTRRDQGWVFASDNPDGPSFPAAEGVSVIARLEHIFTPESLAPELGTIHATSALAGLFGLEALVPTTGRVQGHLFCFIDRKGVLLSPTSLTIAPLMARRAETAFVFAQSALDQWRYLGVGRIQDGVPSHLQIPEVDFEVWRAWGHGRSASRALPDDALDEAEGFVKALQLDPDRVIVRPSGGRAFFRERVPNGLVIDGGLGGFAPRKISLTDVAWVIIAARDVEQYGGLLDEARVNKLRYLNGTPRESTRWIDTGWAIAIYSLLNVAR